MKRVIFVIIFLFLIAIFVHPTYAQEGDTPPPDGVPTPLSPVTHFAHLTTSDGLASAHVEVIFQDSRGFMWFGTRDGLSRYDGYHFTTYRNDPADPNSIIENTILDIMEDSQGRLWFATQNGLSIFDPRLEQFNPLPLELDSATGVFSLFEDGQGQVWLGTNGDQLLRYDPATEHVASYPFPADMPPGAGSQVWDIIEDRAGNLWLAASSGVVKFDPHTGQFTRYVPPNDSGEIRALYEDDAGQIWFNSSSLHKLDPVSKNITTYQLPLGPIPIVDMLVDQNRQVWLASLQGLFRFNLQTEQFTGSFAHHPSDSDSLSSDRTFSLFEDEAGLIWIGTENAGLNLLNPRQSQFAHYQYDPDNPNSLGAARVIGMVGDGTGGLWLGTDDVLNHFDPATGQTDHYFPITSANLDPFGITAMARDAAGKIWFGLGNQLYRFNPEDDQFTTYDLPDGAGGSPNPVTSIYQDETGLLWLGCQRQGFFLFDPDTEMFQPLPDGIALGNVQVIYGDADGTLWLASPGILSRFDLHNERFDSYQAPYAPVNALYQDQSSNLWIAANDGLYRFEPVTTNFTRYTDRDGLPSGNVMAILADESGNLWLSTAQGLARFDPQSETFHTYDVDDGLAGNEFIFGSAWLARNGRMYFGSEQGLTAFYPDQIEEDPYQPPVVLTAVRLFNKPLAIGEDSPLAQAIDFTDHLTFNHNQDIISFEFAALSYAAPYKNRYRYKLDGLEDEWIEVGSDRRFATYTHLPAGDYVFQVQGTNDSGLWSEQEATLNITILPPWWETLWFRSGLLILLAGVAVVGVRWRTNTLRQRSHALEAEVAERTRELAARTERLQESEKRFRQLTDLLPGAVVEMDADLNMTYVNKSGIEMFGYSEEDIKAGLLNGMELVHPDERERATRRIASYFEGKYVPPTEYRFLKKDGTEIPVLLKAAPILREGVISGFRASVTDIRKLKDVEKALRESEQQLLFITDSIPAYVAYVGADDLRYRFVSSKFVEAYKLPREKIIGQHIKNIIGESNFQFALKYIDIVRSGHGTSYENVFETAQGKRWIEVNYMPTFDHRGEVEGIAVLSFDITERKRAEEALRESQEQFALFMDMLPHGVFIKEEDSIVTYVNQFLKDLFDAEHWLDRDAYAAFPDHPALAEAMMADDRNALAQGQTRVEEAMPDKDGNEHVFVTTKFRIPRTDKPPLLGGIGLDITDRVKAERELAATLETAKRLRDEAEAANRAKSIFLANMSHELRTPLNAILGYSQLMARDPNLTATQQKHLETIARGGEHLLGLINNVLTMSKIEAGRTTVQENAFDLHRQLRGLQEMFQMRADDQDITLLLDVAPDVPRYVYADESKLRQVLMNLLSNAVKFTKEGGVTLRAKCQEGKANIEGDGASDTIPPLLLCFEVEDSGAGIAPDEMEMLFKPFIQTTSGQQLQEGTGLGLPISRQFVDLMGGELDMKSIAGQGTTFRVQIPVAVTTADAVEALDWQPQRRVTGIEPGQTAPDGGPFRLLVVEDRATNREVLIELLKPFGFDLRYAVNGAEGVEMWEAWQPHLVWMDMRLPVMDGYEATRQIKARAKAMDRPAIVVALTASAFEEDRATILAAGCDDFVRKPFRERDIFNVLHRHLGVRFIYEDVAPALEAGASVSPEELRAAVERLPVAWAIDLYQAAVTLNNDQMLTLTEEIRPQASHLADVLVQWIHNFEYRKVMALVAPETQ